MIKSQSIVIAGINGFLGSSLASYLKSNHPHLKVYGIARSKSKFSPTSEFNLTNKGKLKGFLSRVKPEIIFVTTGGDVTKESVLIKSNIDVTTSLCDVILSLEINPRIVILSTASEYGLPQKNLKKFKENYIEKPKSIYGQIKLKQTKLASKYVKKGLDIVIARVFNISGYGVPESLSLGRFAKKIVELERNKDTSTLQTRSLDGRRDFLDIDDVAKAVYLLSQKGKSGEVYNVCSAQSYVIRDLLFTMLGLSKRDDIEVIEEAGHVRDSFDVIGSNQKLVKVTGFNPAITIEKSLQRVLDYYRKQK